MAKKPEKKKVGKKKGDEQTSGLLASLAGKILGGKRATRKETESLAGTALAQAPDKKKKTKKKK
jgi:hypothetical protein